MLRSAYILPHAKLVKWLETHAVLATIFPRVIKPRTAENPFWDFLNSYCYSWENVRCGVIEKFNAIYYSLPMENTKEEFYSMSLVTTVFMFLVFSPCIIILVAGTINLIAVKNYWGFATLAVAIFLATLMVKEIIGRSRLLISDDGIEIKSSLEVKKFSWNKVISAETKRYHLGYQFLVIALGSWNSPYVLLSFSKSPADKPESFILFHASARTCDTVSATINDRVKENKRKLNTI